MKPNKVKHFFSFVQEDWNKLRKKPLAMFLVLIALPLIYFIVYRTGGIKFVYSHSMYIPIIIAGIFYGTTFGTLIALMAAILLGPLMPIDTLTGEMQLTINWLYRLFIFMTIGAIIGYASNALRKDSQRIENLMSVNQETQVPNTNYLKKHVNHFHFLHIQSLLSLLIIITTLLISWESTYITLSFMISM